MGQHVHRSIAVGPRGLIALVLAASMAFAALAARPGVEPAAAGGCANADALIDEATAKQLQKALTCLINNKRRDRGKRALDSNSNLREVAGKHNRAMIRENCFAHRCPGEPGLGKRIRRTGYLDGARSWKFAENIGCAPRPQNMFNRWMNGSFHRGNMLNKAYRDVGAAAMKDQVPASGCGKATVLYTVVFAVRKG
jgi:uncharacterized protein YkwD